MGNQPPGISNIGGGGGGVRGDGDEKSKVTPCSACKVGDKQLYN